MTASPPFPALLRCRRCHHAWFRVVRLTRYTYSPGYPLPLPDSLPFSLLVCLCGIPARPPLSGVLKGTLLNYVQSFIDAFNGASL